MCKTQLSLLITNYKIRLRVLVRNCKAKLQNFIISKWNAQSESISPKLPIPLAIFVIVCLLSFLWLMKFNGYIDKDSAKWTLSSQSQATAAILGLLIAAGAFRWLSFANQAERIQNSINSYLRRMHRPIAFGGQQPIIINVFDIMFEDYRRFVDAHRSKKGRLVISKTAFEILGRLWALRLLANYFGPLYIKPERSLTHGLLKNLLKPSRKYAMELWDFYYTDSPKFYILMFDTFNAFRAIVVMAHAADVDYQNDNRKISYSLISDLTDSLFIDDNRLLAEELKRKITFYKPRFYWACAILGSAIIIGLSALSVINNSSCILCAIFGQYSLQTLVIFPVLLSIFGLYVTFLTLEISFR